MTTLSEAEIVHLLRPYLREPSDLLLDRLSLYLDLLLRWNARTNLTAIRSPSEIVKRHFGESLFAAQRLDAPTTLLDYGSGAGLPGIPIALLCPETRVTLAESQNKKSTFLREAVRVLGLSTAVWSRRAEEMPPEVVFDCVILRAVDDMAGSVTAASRLSGGTLAFLTTRSGLRQFAVSPSFELMETIALPESKDGIFVRYARV